MKDCKLNKIRNQSFFSWEGFFQEFWEAAISFLMKHVQNVYDSSRVQFIFLCLLLTDISGNVIFLFPTFFAGVA